MRCLVVLAVIASVPAACSAGVVAAPRNLGAVRARYPMSDRAVQMLRTSGFVVLDNVARRRLHEAYPLHDSDPYLFVTTDAMLRLWSELYRDELRRAERDRLLPSLTDAVAELAKAAGAMRDREADPACRDALDRVEQLLAVGRALLAGETSDRRPAVSALISKVMAHAGAAPYPGEDYTQYTVRGHYAGDVRLARYFRGSMWLTRSFLAVGDAPEGDPAAPLCTAVAAADVLRATPHARESLRKVCAARLGMVGQPNAISVEQVVEALDKALGPKWRLSEALRPEAMTALRRTLAGPEYPAALVSTRTTLPGIPFPARVVAFLPDGAVPDSVLFQDTTNDRIAGRELPMGCEVAAALGSRTAREVIRSTDPRAGAVLAAVDRHNALAQDDERGIYRGWMHALSTLNRTDPRAPDFMRTPAWGYEKLNTCLGGWTQLRHANVLYASQTYVVQGLESPPPGALVEPIPAFYTAMASVARRTRLLLGGSSAKTAALPAFEERCRAFAAYAEEELAGRLTAEHAADIHTFGAWLERYQFSGGPIVVDVATGMRQQVLHAGVGDLNPIIVVPDPKRPVAYVGWVSAYYEFERPNSDRLTDQRWRAIAAAPGLLPNRPAWTGAFVASDRGREWQAREPVRSAESLFQTGRAEEAIRLLRTAIASQPRTEVALESHLRIAQHLAGPAYGPGGLSEPELGKPQLADNGADPSKPEYALAESELIACLRLPGGEAWDQAQLMLRHLTARRSLLQRGGRETPSRQTDDARRAITAIADARTDAEREAIERAAAAAVLRLQSERDGVPDRAGLLEDALAACRTPSVREALEYHRIALSARLQSRSYIMTRDELADAIALFLTSARSPALRAAAAAHAVWLRAAEPPWREASDTMRSCLRAAAGSDDRSEALRLVTETASGDRFDSTLPGAMARRAAEMVCAFLATRAWQEGHLAEAVAIERDFANSANSGGTTHEKLYATYADFGREPLRLFARTETLTGRPAAQSLATIALKYPTCKLAPHALLRAEALLREAGDTQAADRTAKDVIRRYPESAPGLLLRARAAFERDDLAAAAALVALSCRVAEREPPEIGERIAYGQGQSLRFTIDSVRKATTLLAPALKRLGYRGTLKPADVAKGLDHLATLLVKALPARSPDVLLALLKLPNSERVAERFVARYPDHSRAGDVLAVLSAAGLPPRDESDSPCPPGWLIRLVNRGRAYRHAGAALVLFRKCFRSDKLTETLESTRAVRARHPGTRSGWAADCVAAAALLGRDRPEMALSAVDQARRGLAANDPLSADCRRIVARARAEVSAKQRRQWSPLWTSRGAADQDPGHAPDPKVKPLLAENTLYIADVRDYRWNGIHAVDARTGARLWTAPVGPLCDMDIDVSGPLVCASADGRVTAVDRRTGAILWKADVKLDRSTDAEAPTPGSMAPMGGGPAPNAGLTIRADAASGQAVVLRKGRPLARARFADGVVTPAPVASDDAPRARFRSAGATRDDQMDRGSAALEAARPSENPMHAPPMRDVEEWQGVLYPTADGYLVTAIDAATGATLARHPRASNRDCQVIAGDDAVYVVYTGGQVTAFPLLAPYTGR